MKRKLVTALILESMITTVIPVNAMAIETETATVIAKEETETATVVEDEKESEVETTKELPVEKSVQSLPVLGVVDSLHNGDMINSSEIQVRGWSAGTGGIKNIKIYYNGKLMVNSVANEKRPDVIKVYPQYGNHDWGYNYLVPINENCFEHHIYIVATMQDGSSDYWNRTVYTKKVSNRICLDTPRSTTRIEGNTLHVSGWSLGGSPNKKAEVYIDNKKVGEVSTGVARPDVNRVYPEYNNTNAGYAGDINIGNISDGKRTLKVVVTNESGTKNTVETKIVKGKAKLNNRGCIDSPSGTVTGSHLYISGWHLSSSGTKSVKAYIDGKELGNLEVNVSRPDVNKVYPEYNNTNSGFKGNLNFTGIGEGNKTLKIVVTNNDGSTSTMTRGITVNRPANISHIDSPTIDYDYYSNSITIRGWALSGYGIRGIHVYIDGKVYRGISTDIYRPDVERAYPQYKDSYSGFSITIPMSGLATGQHEAKLYIITGNNTVYHPTIISGEDRENKTSVSFYNSNLNVNSHTYYGGNDWRRTVLDHAFGMRGVAYYLGGNWNNARYVTFNGNYHFTPVSQLPKTGAVPGYGLDCAGFVQRCYAMAGINIGQTTWAITSSYNVTRTYNPRPGDLYFKNNLEHVGIFLKDNGDGTFTYIDCNQTWEGGLKENHVRGRVEVRREKKIRDCMFYTRR